MKNIDPLHAGSRPATFFEKESLCDYHFRGGGPYWHLATPGMSQEVLFISEDDFRFGMSSAAICAAETGIVILAHTLMGNHIHDIVQGSNERCMTYITRRRDRLRRYLRQQGRDVDMKAFTCDPIPITNLEMLRNEIVYVHRNGYVVNPCHTPFSYPWGTGPYYFNPLAREDEGVAFSSLKYKIKREEVFHGRDARLPEGYRFRNGFIYPPSYCRIDEGEKIFRDAHQYFTLLSKNVEAYSEEAKRLGDTIVLTDEEMFPTMQIECRKRFGKIKRPAELSRSEKVELARVMHEDYAASNSQIQRILSLDIQTVNSLYPLKARK